MRGGLQPPTLHSALPLRIALSGRFHHVFSQKVVNKHLRDTDNVPPAPESRRAEVIPPALFPRPAPAPPAAGSSPPRPMSSGPRDASGSVSTESGLWTGPRGSGRPSGTTTGSRFPAATPASAPGLRAPAAQRVLGF